MHAVPDSSRLLPKGDPADISYPAHRNSIRTHRTIRTSCALSFSDPNARRMRPFFQVHNDKIHRPRQPFLFASPPELRTRSDRRCSRSLPYPARTWRGNSAPLPFRDGCGCRCPRPRVRYTPRRVLRTMHRSYR